MKNIYVFLLLIIISKFSYAGDDFKSFYNSQNTNYKQDSNGFVNYKKQQKEEFANYIKNSWKKFRSYKGKKTKIKRKPKRQPIAIRKYKAKKENKTNIKKPKIKQALQAVVAKKNIVIDFWGNKLKFKKVVLPVFNKVSVNKKVMISYWNIDDEEFEYLAKPIKKYKKEFNLDDWAVFKITESLSQYFYNNETLISLFTWKMLNDLKYDIRLATRNNRFVLLLPFKMDIYAKSYVKIKNQKFYIFDKKKSSRGVKTYAKAGAGLKKLSYFQPGQIIWPSKSMLAKYRALTFKYNNKKVAINIGFNSNRISYLATYPQVEFANYFAQNLSSITKNSLVESVAPYLKNENRLTQLDFLLKMIQFGISYETDQKQFGRERYMYFEETIAYPYADCEDRSFLYGWMAKNLLNVDFIGLLYPNHVAVALKLSHEETKKIGGTKVIYKGSVYTVADPTYVGAGIGMANTKGKKPKIIYSSI